MPPSSSDPRDPPDDDDGAWKRFWDWAKDLIGGRGLHDRRRRVRARLASVRRRWRCGRSEVSGVR
jgi:hypothetical protein